MFHQISNSERNYNYNAYVYKNAYWDFHFHANYELICSLEGATRISRGGTFEELLEGEMVIVPPNTVHSLTADNTRTWVGVFSEDFIPAFSQKNKSLIYSKFRCSDEIYSFLKENLLYTGLPDRYMICACLYLVCNECTKNATASPSDAEFIGKVVNYISENLSREISLSDVAESLGYEYHYFSGLFNSVFGINFKSYINTYRFNEACRMLSSKEKSITEISSECGFGSIRNFNRVFKKLCNMSPSDYRDSAQRKTK